MAISLMVKSFRIAAHAIKAIVIGRGSCIASDRITVDGEQVGYCYREAPDTQHDSGWRFFAGDESQEYADTPENFALYDVNTIANYDPSIIGILEAPSGSEFERDQAGVLVQVLRDEA